MKITLGNHQWFDGEGKPLVAGRVSVYLHDSNVRADIYSLEGDTYVQMENPVILDDLGSCDSIWFDAGIVDVRVERYNGVPGSYSLVDTYSDGFVVPDVTNDTLVYGIEALAAANPSLGTVTVAGYSNAHDCGARTFVWDPSCTANEDGGAIIASTTSEDGRWILLSDERYMPCSWYGIRTGAEANISAFLTYPSHVGQWSIKLPPVPRFKAGTYVSTGIYSTTKTLAFDTGAKFTRATFSCYAAEVMYNSDYVANFLFGKQAYADSSWFRTVESFWTCRAYELHQNRTNYFTDSAKSNNTGVAFQRVSGTPIAMTGTGQLQFNSCEFEDGCLSTDWYMSFENQNFSDRWFTGSVWDFGTWPAHHIRVVPSSCRAILSDFLDANVWLLLVASWGVSHIDLEGRHVGTVSASMPFTQIDHGTVDELHMTKDTVLRDCIVYSLSMENNLATLAAQDSSLIITGNKAKSLTLTRCDVSLGVDISTFRTAISASDTGFSLSNGSITRDDPSDHMYGSTSQFDRCSFVGGVVANNALYIRDSRIIDCAVYLFPQSSDALFGAFERNTWSGTSQLHIAPGIDDHSSMDIYEVSVGYLSIKDNTFNTTYAGITMPFWAQDMEHRFMKGCCSTVDVTNVAATYAYGWVYQGNTGNCPNSYGMCAVTQFNSSAVKQITFGTGADDTVRFVSNGYCNVFVLPVLQSDGGHSVNDGWVVDDTALACTPFRGLAQVSQGGHVQGGARFPATMYIPLCAIDRTLPNSMFSCYLGGSNAILLYGAVPIPANQ